ncbi:hypothetical protein KJA14_00030 [Patescibacteria group bacterium]|nr:hypothetical protein [Patescibacteria group bacterium]
MKSQSNQNQEIVFKKDPSKIISELMEKYGLSETKENFLEKIRKGETTTRRKIAEIIRGVIDGKISTEDLVTTFQQHLNVSKETAEKLAEDIKREIPISVKRVLKEEISPSPKREVALPKKPIVERTETKTPTPPKKPLSPSKKDIYREPIK